MYTLVLRYVVLDFATLADCLSAAVEAVGYNRFAVIHFNPTGDWAVWEFTVRFNNTALDGLNTFWDG